MTRRGGSRVPVKVELTFAEARRLKQLAELGSKHLPEDWFLKERGFGGGPGLDAGQRGIIKLTAAISWHPEGGGQ